MRQSSSLRNSDAGSSTGTYNREAAGCKKGLLAEQVGASASSDADSSQAAAEQMKWHSL